MGVVVLFFGASARGRVMKKELAELRDHKAKTVCFVECGVEPPANLAKKGAKETRSAEAIDEEMIRQDN